MTLTEFLLARIAEDEAVAKSLGRDGSSDSPQLMPTLAGGAHIASTPSRVLAECEAKRRCIEAAWNDHVDIAQEWGAAFSTQESMSANGDDPNVVRALAAVYSDHPDYREEWRP